MPRLPLKDRRVDGLGKAYSTIPDQIKKVIAEFTGFNTREAKVAFADHWIGVWAKDFGLAWPVVYQLLHMIEEDHLYKDPRRVGPDAPGGRETHGDKPCYDSFEDYFTDRIRQPFELWAKLESTYQYAHTYAPELFGLPYITAQARRATEAAQADAQDKENLRPVGRPKGDRVGEETIFNIKKNDVKDYTSDTSVDVVAPVGNSIPYAHRRLRKDRPDIHARVLTGEITPNAGMVEAGFRKPLPSRKLGPLDRILKILPLLTHNERDELRRILDT